MCHPARRAAGCAAALAAALRLLACLLLAAAALPAAAQSYTASATAADATAYPWIDISSTGTGLTLGDDGVSATLSIGFNITLGSVTYTGLRVMSNGQVQFGGSDTAYVNTALPLDGSSGRPVNIDAVLLPLWDDLNPGANQVRWRSQGTAPNRVFVVSWLSVPFYGTSNTATFQVQLHEQGAIVYRYGAVVGGGNGATIGLEVSNTDYVQYALNTAAVTNGTTIVWRYNTVALVAGLRYSFESHDLAGAYIKQETPLGWMRSISPASPSADKAAASFIARPGLADSSCWSFESVSQPGYYLRHYSFRLQADAYTNTTIYLQDATFCLRPGRASTAKLTFVSYNYPGYYIRRLSDGTVGLGPPDGSADYDGRATFEPETALADLPAQRLARYRLEENSWNGTAGELKDTAGATGGPYNGQAQGSPVPTLATASPARAGTSGTCGYATLPGPDTGGGSFVVNGMPLSTTTAARASVSFWMYWTGASSDVAIGFQDQNLAVTTANFGFGTNNSSDNFGIASTGLANTWVHVVAVFNNGSIAGNKLYINGVLQTLSQRAGTPNLARATVSSNFYIGAYGAATSARFEGRLDEVQVYQGELTSAEVTTLYNETHNCVTLTKLQIEHASGTGLTCAPSTLTVKACQDSACTTPYTAGVTGTMTASGGTVVWPDGTSISIPAGSSSTTVRMQSTTTTATLVGATAGSPTAGSATTCNFGSPSCTFTATASALVVSVPNHVADAPATVSISAVGSSGGTCTTALAGATRNINLRCSYADPATGTLPVRVTAGALNSANSATSACDGTGRTASLTFNSSGVASTTLQYADAGQVRLSATYTGSAATGDNGLTMTGSTLFVAAPLDFAVVPAATTTTAATTSTASITARNANGATTPNFGRESQAESVTAGFIRTQPSGTGAVAGSFSGTPGSFSNGVATLTGLSWTEVGRYDIAVALTSSSYLGSGQTAAGSSAGSWVLCASENATCTVPSGAVATVYYGAQGRWYSRAGRSGAVSCSNGTFGDPLVGTPKNCYYIITSGTALTGTGAILSRPHRFNVANTAACGSFSYAGQPFAVRVTALNANGAVTANYDGSAATSPNFAKAVTLSEPTALGVGSLSGSSIAASAFSAGVATGSASYAFTSKATSPRSLVLRATDADGINSSAGTEPAMPLRSGRLRLSSAFGKATAALQLAAVTEYWSGSAWLLNSDDSCTALAGASVALSNPRSATGAASTATSSAGALAISGGNGSITLAAPSPAGSSLSLDVALNLGSTTTDQSCQASRPATTGAGLPWLRSLNGSCATTADRDPAARASFGIFAPETRKTVHVRDIF